MNDHFWRRLQRDELVLAGFWLESQRQCIMNPVLSSTPAISRGTLISISDFKKRCCELLANTLQNADRDLLAESADLRLVLGICNQTLWLNLCSVDDVRELTDFEIVEQRIQNQLVCSYEWFLLTKYLLICCWVDSQEHIFRSTLRKRVGKRQDSPVVSPVSFLVHVIDCCPTPRIQGKRNYKQESATEKEKEIWGDQLYHTLFWCKRLSLFFLCLYRCLIYHLRFDTRKSNSTTLWSFSWTYMY